MFGFFHFHISDKADGVNGMNVDTTAGEQITLPKLCQIKKDMKDLAVWGGGMVPKLRKVRKKIFFIKYHW